MKRPHTKALVIDWFDTNLGTIKEASEALGISAWSVGNIVKFMRYCEMPMLRNVVDGTDRRIYPGDMPIRKAPPGFVEEAIKNRNEIELAWF